MKDNLQSPAAQATGIGFTEVSIEALLAALEQAEQLYQQGNEYKRVQQRGMQQNFSWQAAVTEYLELYQQALK